MNNPISFLFAFCIKGMQSYYEALEAESSDFAKIFAFIFEFEISEGILLSPPENSCTSSGTQVVPELFQRSGSSYE